MENLLEVKGLYASYKESLILQDINLCLKPGQILGIVGESGSGKSTLFKALLGLEEDLFVDKGSISYKGLNLREYKGRRSLLGKEISALFQDPSYSLVPTRKIGRQFEETLRSHNKWSKERIKKRTLELFSLLSLKEGEKLYESYPFELSGGMQQRVCLALSLILKPQLLLCDEPTSGLDVQVERQIIEALAEFRDKEDLAIVLITHNLALAQYLCDTIMVFYGGRVLEYRPAQDIKIRPLHPYTRDLLEAVPRFLGPRPKAIEGERPKFPLGEKCVYLNRCKESDIRCQSWKMETFDLKRGRVSCWRKKDG